MLIALVVIVVAVWMLGEPPSRLVAMVPLEVLALLSGLGRGDGCGCAIKHRELVG